MNICWCPKLSPGKICFNSSVRYSFQISNKAHIACCQKTTNKYFLLFFYCLNYNVKLNKNTIKCVRKYDIE